MIPAAPNEPSKNASFPPSSQQARCKCVLVLFMPGCASTVWRNALPSFAVIIAQADALPPLPSSISHANCFLCRSLIRIAKVSEEGRGGEEKAEEMLAKDARSPLRSLARGSAQWGEMDGNGEEEGGGEGGGAALI